MKRFIDECLSNELTKVAVARGILNLRASAIVNSTAPRTAAWLPGYRAFPACGFRARDLMLITAFAVILVTVLLQGRSLGLAIRLAQPPHDVGTAPSLDLQAAETAMYQVQLGVVESRAYSDDGTLIHPQLLRRYRTRGALAAECVGTDDERRLAIASDFDVIIAAVDAGRANSFDCIGRAGLTTKHCTISNMTLSRSPQNPPERARAAVSNAAGYPVARLCQIRRCRRIQPVKGRQRLLRSLPCSASHMLRASRCSQDTLHHHSPALQCAWLILCACVTRSEGLRMMALAPQRRGKYRVSRIA